MDGITADRIEAALHHVMDHGFGDSVDDDEIIEIAASMYLFHLRQQENPE